MDPKEAALLANKRFRTWVDRYVVLAKASAFCTVESLARENTAGRVQVKSYRTMASAAACVHVRPMSDHPFAGWGAYVFVVDCPPHVATSEPSDSTVGNMHQDER